MTLAISDVTTAIKENIQELITRRGSLLVHLSGEGKVAFQGPRGGEWKPFIVTCFNGDIGCMMPASPDTEVCAKSAFFRWLNSMSIVPHLNLGGNSEFTLSDEEWAQEIQKFSEYCEDNIYREEFVWEIKSKPENSDKEVVIIVIKIKPIANVYVTGIWSAVNNHEYLCQITALHHPEFSNDARFMPLDKWKYGVEDPETGARYVLDYQNTVLMSGLDYPAPGNHLFYDKENEKYVVISEDDYTPRLF